MEKSARFFILMRHSELRLRRLYSLFHTHAALRVPDVAIILAFSYSFVTLSLGCGDCTRFFILIRYSEPRMRRLYSLFHTHAALQAPDVAIVLAFSYSFGTSGHRRGVLCRANAGSPIIEEQSAITCRPPNFKKDCRTRRIHHNRIPSSCSSLLIQPAGYNPCRCRCLCPLIPPPRFRPASASSS